MEQQDSTFQWSIFNVDRSQQFVVRCDDFDKFVTAVQQVLSLMPGLELPLTVERLSAEQRMKPQITPEAQPPVQAPAQPEHFCQRHHVQMTLRTNKNTGEAWYEHRWSENDPEMGVVWHRCNGMTERTSRAKTTEIKEG